MFEQVNELLNKYVPEFPKEVKLQLPTLKKIELPKLKKLELYIEMFKRMIDDEGEQQDFETPYIINDTNICCGHILEELEEGKKMYCEICGQEYEVE